MDYPQSVTIPIIRIGSTKINVGLGQSEFSISIKRSNSLLTLNNGKKGKVFTSPEILYGLKKLVRNPKDILEKKAAMAGKDLKGKSVNIRRDINVEMMTNLSPDLPKLIKKNLKKDSHEISSSFKRNIEVEIDIQLMFLNQIQQLQETIQFERTTTNNEIIKATQKIKLLEEEKAELNKLHQEDMKEKMVLQIKCQQLQNKFGELCMESLTIEDMETNQVEVKKALGGKLAIPQGPCIKFSNLFDLSGQLIEFCCGEYGSKFVIERLQNGASPEKDYAMKELNLPYSLSHLLENPHSAKVATVLAKIDHKGRADILFHLETHFSQIANNIKGGEFIVNVFRSANKTEQMSIAQSALTRMSKLETFPDKNQTRAHSHLSLESQEECNIVDC